MTNDNDYMWGPNYDINFNDNDGDDDNDGFVVDDPPICVAGIITIPNNNDTYMCRGDNRRRALFPSAHTQFWAMMAMIEYNDDFDDKQW